MPPRASALIVSLAAVGALGVLPAAAAPRNTPTPSPSPTPTSAQPETPSSSPSAEAEPSPSAPLDTSVTEETGRISTQGTRGKPGGGGGSGAFALNATVRQADADDVLWTYRDGCPVEPDALRVLEVNHWKYDGNLGRGVLVLHADAVDRTIRALQIGADAGFPIFQMKNPDEWDGKDEAQMEDNNSSAFNCRHVVGNPLAVSPHSYGRAVDINPVQNPYKSVEKKWYPDAGATWINRSLNDPGMLFKDTSLTRGLTRNGYTWGGTWVNPDYQHFQMN